MAVPDCESPVRSLLFHSVTHQSSETAELKVLLPSLQFLSMILTNGLHIFKIPSPFYRNLVIDVHLNLRLWPKHYLCATLCPAMSEISTPQSFNIHTLYCYPFTHWVEIAKSLPWLQFSLTFQYFLFFARRTQSNPVTSNMLSSAFVTFEINHFKLERLTSHRAHTTRLRHGLYMHCVSRWS